MRRHTLWMLAVSVTFGLLAVMAARMWLSPKPMPAVAPIAAAPKVETRTVVVASAPLKFGDLLAERSLKEVAWPVDAIPAGTFSTIAEAMRDGKRTVLAAIQPNEPLLQAKVTGPGQRATLSAILSPEMKAVSIRVNDVGGVAGFVVPGDRVDVLMTRQKDGEAPRTEVVLQRIKVLAIDQNADDSAAKPSVAKAVTLEVDLASAQKLSVAGLVGTLSLALRRAGELEVGQTRSVGLSDPTRVARLAPEPQTSAKVTVFRGTTSQQYTVAIESEAVNEVQLGEPSPMGPQSALSDDSSRRLPAAPARLR